MRALLALFLAVAPSAFAAELAGVTLPDTDKLGETELVLNGMGLREFMWIDIYVGGIYLPEKTTDWKKAVEADVPKKFVMHFIFRKVSRDRMLDTFRDGLAKQEGLGDYSADLAKLESFMDSDVVSGDRIVLDYVPDEGFTVISNGEVKGKVGDAAFMRGIWSIFLGDKPASEKLKKGLLGG